MGLKKEINKRSKYILGLSRKTFAVFFKSQPFNYSAAVSFYTIFSLPAILLITIFIAGTTFDQDMVEGALFQQIRRIIGAENTDQIRIIVENAQLSGSFTFMNIVGIALLIFSATTVFIALQDGLNDLWEVNRKPKNTYLKLVFNRLLSFGIIVGFGFLMLVFLIVDAGIIILKEYIIERFPDFFLVLLEGLNYVLSALIIMLIFSLVFKVLPETKTKWRQVWFGSILTTILFILGKAAINFYLQKTWFTATYGVAGSFVAILLWIYYSCLLLFLGAAFIKANKEYSLLKNK